MRVVITDIAWGRAVSLCMVRARAESYLQDARYTRNAGERDEELTMRTQSDEIEKLTFMCREPPWKTGERTDERRGNRETET